MRHCTEMLPRLGLIASLLAVGQGRLLKALEGVDASMSSMQLNATQLNAEGQAPVNIVLRSRVLSDGSAVRLGQLAALSGSENALRLLGELIVLDGLSPGQERKLTREQIEQSIQRALPGMVARFSGAQVVQVNVAGLLLESTRLVEFATNNVKDYFGKREDLEVTIEVTSQPEPLVVPAGALEFRLDNGWNGLPLGARKFRVIVLKDGRQVQDAVVGLNVRVFQQCLVAAQTILSGTIVDEGDFRLQQEEVRGRALFPSVSAKQLNGQQAKHQIPEGKRIEERSFELLPVIRRGDRVIVEVARGGLSIKSVGEARNDAGMGQTIRLRLLDGEQEILARATGPGEAQL